MPMPDPTPLTARLLAHDPEAFQRATQAPFLRHAASGTLPKAVLSAWLSQDRLYAQAYIRFASRLLANVPLPAAADALDFNERLADTLLAALLNVRRELKFFETSAAKYGLDLTVRAVSGGLRRYRELFEEAGSAVENWGTAGDGGARETQLLQGLVVLWGTEVAYLTAWKHASALLAHRLELQGQAGAEGGEEDLDGGALRHEFIPNWSSAEFEAFVGDIAGLLDELWAKGERGAGEEEKLKKVWESVLVVEEGFWPVV